MLTITVPEKEMFNENTSEFYTIKGATISLEHSLVSISKWESKWKKPFLSCEKSIEEWKDYFRCMTITQNIDPKVYDNLTDKNISDIVDYINDPMTATTFSNNVPGTAKTSREIVTSELIYFWMLSYGIPKEFDKWHLNRLLTLIRIFGIKNSPQKKMSKNDILARNKALNASRKARMGSRG